MSVRGRGSVAEPEPEPPPVTIPLRDLIAMFTGVTAEVMTPVTEERVPQELGVSGSSGSLTAVEAPAIRKREEAMATHTPVALAAEVPVRPEASMPGPALAAAQEEPPAAKTEPETPSPELDSEASTETNTEQDVQAATNPEKALEIVQSPHAPTLESVSVANREAP